MEFHRFEHALANVFDARATHADALRTWLLVSERDLSLNYVLHIDSFVEDVHPCRETGLVEGRRCACLLPPLLDTPCSCALAGRHAENVFDPSDDTLSLPAACAPTLLA